MTFQFDVNLTEQDYFNYNCFWNFKSPYGKKQLLTIRVIFGIIFIALGLYTMWDGGFSTEAILISAPYFIMLIVFQLIFNPLISHSLKRNIKALKKKGKMCYSPFATMTFNPDTILHVSPEMKNEVAYSLIERVSILNGYAIYIHLNNLTAYIILFSCFSSDEETEKFIEFLKSKCNKVKYYK